MRPELLIDLNETQILCTQYYSMKKIIEQEITPVLRDLQEGIKSGYDAGAFKEKIISDTERFGLDRIPIKMNDFYELISATEYLIRTIYLGIEEADILLSRVELDRILDYGLQEGSIDQETVNYIVSDPQILSGWDKDKTITMPEVEPVPENHHYNINYSSAASNVTSNQTDYREYVDQNPQNVRTESTQTSYSNANTQQTNHINESTTGSDTNLNIDMVKGSKFKAYNNNLGSNDKMAVDKGKPSIAMTAASAAVLGGAMTGNAIASAHNSKEQVKPKNSGTSSSGSLSSEQGKESLEKYGSEDIVSKTSTTSSNLRENNQKEPQEENNDNKAETERLRGNISHMNSKDVDKSNPEDVPKTTYESGDVPAQDKVTKVKYGQESSGIKEIEY